MKNLIVVLGLVLLGANALAKSTEDEKEARAYLVAELRTGAIEGLNKSIVIKSNASGSAWTIEEWNECPSYPCKPKDYMVQTVVKPEVIEDTRGTDGSLVLKLNDQMTIVQYFGFPEPGQKRPDAVLKYIQGSTVREIDLSLTASIYTDVNE